MKHDIDVVCPGFSDLKKQPAILKQLAEYALEAGYKQDEIKDIRDRRHLLTMYKAMMFDHHIDEQAKQRKK